MSRDSRNDVLLLLKDTVENLPLDKLSDWEYDALAESIESLVDMISDITASSDGTPAFPPLAIAFLTLRLLLTPYVFCCGAAAVG